MKEHHCPQNLFSDRGIQVIYDPSDADWQSWRLRVALVANEQMVRDGQAEAVGDMQCEHEFPISYCPFCGTKLDVESEGTRSSNIL